MILRSGFDDWLEVVPKQSAILPGYSSYGIHANHMVSLDLHLLRPPIHAE
jgi:hypothetical protein